MQIAILSEDGARLPDGQTGEICVRGPAVFAGYNEDPAANAAAFRHGWFHTGDLGRLDSRGFVYIVGRASDMYISGGANVYPREIEEVLLTHPAVSQVAVVGVPDARWGEVGIAVIVIRDRQSFGENAVRSFLEGKLARYKWPKRVTFWNELPTSAYGKVAKREIRERLTQELADFAADESR
jgi:acyl-CoA synthetase (AMP-forming)/AMP-acid ligase II